METKKYFKFVLKVSFFFFIGYNFYGCIFNSKAKCPKFIKDYLCINFEINTVESFAYNDSYTHPKFYLFKIKVNPDSNIMDRLISIGFIPYTSMDTFKIKNNDFSLINGLFSNWVINEICKRKPWWKLNQLKSNYFVKPILIKDSTIVEQTWHSEFSNGRILIEPIDSLTAFGFIEENNYWRSISNISNDSIGLY